MSECGCKVIWKQTAESENSITAQAIIEYCPLHASAEKLRDATLAIYKALQNNAAPMNLRFALREIQKQEPPWKITISAELLIDLVDAVESAAPQGQTK